MPSYLWALPGVITRICWPESSPGPIAPGSGNSPVVVSASLSARSIHGRPQRPEPAATGDIIQSQQLYPLKLTGHSIPRASGLAEPCKCSNHPQHHQESKDSTHQARLDRRGHGTAVPLVHSNQQGPQTPHLGGLSQGWITEAVIIFTPFVLLSTPMPMDAG